MSQINTNWTQTETPAIIPNKWAELLGVKWSRSNPSWNNQLKIGEWKFRNWRMEIEEKV
jgi:hypothetical protein